VDAERLRREARERQEDARTVRQVRRNGSGKLTFPLRPSPVDALLAAPGRALGVPPSQWSRSRPRRRAAYIRATLAFTIR
jgi:hypothetical protein